jgi:hypothetical protein
MLLLFTPWVARGEHHPKALHIHADVTFLVVDLKYHSTRGAQICEIQHGVPSLFKGHNFAHGSQSKIAKNLIKELNKYYEYSWFQGIAFADATVRDEFSSMKNWINIRDLKHLKKNDLFLLNAALPVKDPTDLDSYHGFVIIDPKNSDDRESFQKKYPGVLLIDNSTYKYRRNKFKWTELLMGHPLTEQHKPKWGLYSKKYGEGLTEIINNDIDSDRLVIKPLDAWAGQGVIILEKEDLNEVLEYIYKRKPPGLPNTEPGYEYWLSNDAEYFMVEEFIEVDPVAISHLDGKLYSPTIRLAFLLFYNKQKIEIICLGGNYALPAKAITEPGTLIEKYKNSCKIPYFSKGDPEIMEKASEQLKEVLNIVYQKMLNF